MAGSPATSHHNRHEQVLYHPLDAERKEIRLLEFHEDFDIEASDPPIACNMTIFSLDDADMPPYYTISYIWGDPSIRREVIVNGIPFEAPQNAEIALRNLHSRTSSNKPVRVWIDSICINQESNAERSQQVAMMGDVFFQAHEVLIWLGPDDSTTAEAVRSIELIMGQCRAETENLMKLMEALYRPDGKGGYNFSYSECALPNGIHWPSLRIFFSSPWFRRLWVIQETALSREAICFKGAYALDFMDVLVCAQWLQHKKYWEHSSGQIETIDATNFMFHLRIPLQHCNRPGHTGWCRIRECSEGVELGLAMSKAGAFSTSEPRDQVYGILSLLGHLEASILMVDYNLPLTEVFARAAKVSIRTTTSLDVLRRSGILGGVDLEWYIHQDWPTWIPCWHLQRDSERDPWILNHLYNASDTLMVSSDIENGPWQSLQVYGIELGHVRYVSAVLPHAEKDLWNRVDLEGYLQDLLNDVKQATPWLQHSMDATVIAFLMALCAGESDFSPAGPSELLITSTPTTAHGWNLSLQLSDTSFILLPEGRTKSMLSYATRRCVFITSNGYIGLGTSHTQPGDIACILEGGQKPYVLRARGDRWLLLGECYVDGAMQGEIIRSLERTGQLEESWKLYDIR